MLENAGNMIYQEIVTKENSATAASSTAIQIAKILTSKTTQLSKAKTAKLALPSARQTTTTTSTLTADDLSQATPGQSLLLKSATRTFLNSLTSKDTTSTTLSSPLATARAKLATAVATKFSSATTATSKAKDIFTNLTPAYVLTTLAATIVSNVKHNNHNSNSSTNNYNSKNSRWTNSKTIEAEIATNLIVKRRMSQQNDNENEVYHMLSLNHLNSTNVLQHHQQKQQHHRPRRQCSNKHLQHKQQQQKFKQFLLLLTCFVAIITIFSLPHLSRAAAAVAIPTISHMSTAYETPTTAAITTYTDAKPVKSLTVTNAGIKTLEELKSPTFNSSTDNESKDGDSSYGNSSSSNNKNKIADNSDNVDNLTSFSPLATTIANSFRDFITSSGSRSSRQSFLENPIILRFIRSLDVSGNSGGVAVGGGSGISSIFSPSPGGSAGLTNIFNQNLDTGLSNNIECPSFDESSACPCYKFEDVGLIACLAFVTSAQAAICCRRQDNFCRKFENVNEIIRTNNKVKNDQSRIWIRVNNIECARLTKKMGPCASGCKAPSNCRSTPFKSVCGANNSGTSCRMYANMCMLKAAACINNDLFPAVKRRCTDVGIITVGRTGECAPK